FPVLEKLEAIAEDKQDHQLSGYVYYNIAGAYYDHNEHDKSFFYIQKALYELLRSPNREYVARTYNLFAVESQRIGCMSTAYQYYMLAELFLGDVDAPIMKAIISSNIAELLCDLGNTKASYESLHASIAQFEKVKTPEIGHNLVTAYVNLVILCVHTGRMDEAQESFERISKLVDEYKLEENPIIERCVLLAQASLAVVNRNDLLIQDISAEILSDIIQDSAFFTFFLKDTCRYIQLLVNHKEWKLVGTMIEAIERSLPNNTSAWLQNQVVKLKIAYFGATGNGQAMFESYAKRSQLNRTQHDIMRQLSYESICLIRIIDELQSELGRVQRENKSIQTIAETDSLVAIPNRRALNRTIDESFHKAVAQQHGFGVGIVDIDSFKQYNDVYGHLAGDECLRSIAKTLDDIAHEHNLFVARYGGDEFVYIYEGLTDEQIEAIEQEIYEQCYVGVTHGYANTIPSESMRPWDLFMKADEQLYKKKQKYS
ncbi:MAG: GGDEF domain-containing protein, partial [Atopobiaceae bacterium]|nr:GGDEF domain-containing protein [Atopobiaceae bacterium]